MQFFNRLFKNEKQKTPKKTADDKQASAGPKIVIADFINLEQKEQKRNSSAPPLMIVKQKPPVSISQETKKCFAINGNDNRMLTIPDPLLKEPLLKKSQSSDFKEYDIIDTAKLKKQNRLENNRDVIIDIAGLEKKARDCKEQPCDDELSTKHVFDKEDNIRHAEKILDETRNILLETPVSAGFLCSLLTFLGSTPGFIYLCIHEDRLDSPFFAAQAAGIAMLLAIAAIVASCLLVSKMPLCGFSFVPIIYGMIALQYEINDYYGGPAYAAEGAGVLGLAALASLCLTCRIAPKTEVRHSPLSLDERKKISSVLMCFDINKYTVERLKDNNDFDLISFFIKDKKNALIPTRMQIGLLKNSLFQALPKLGQCNNIIAEYAIDYPEEIERTVARLHAAYPKLGK
jgi:hypothetical protein